MVTVIDASGSVTGRLGSRVAERLLHGEEIVIVNSEKALISGKKRSLKSLYMKKREVGTSRKGPFYPRMPDRILKRTIRGMLPYQTPHGRAAYKRLKCYIGIPDEFKNAKFEVIEGTRKTFHRYMTIEELARLMGAK